MIFIMVLSGFESINKHPEKFGTGYDTSIWVTEVANNAGVGGALIPMISLGIPGDGTTVLLKRDGSLTS